MPIVATSTSAIAPSCASPGSSTSSGRVNTAAISTNSDTQSWIPRTSVPMNDASAILAVTAATTEVGGVSSHAVDEIGVAAAHETQAERIEAR